MGQWGNVDNAASAIQYAGALRKKKPTSANRAEMFSNTAGPGIFAVAPGEANALEGKVTHAGWIFRTVGTGGRAGRVFTETLVAMGSITGDDEDVVTPDVLISITTQPLTKSVAAPAATTFSVVSATAPVTAMTYQWQISTGGAYSNVTNAGIYTGATTATLAISATTGLNGNRYRCIVSAAAATPKTSAPAVLTVT